MREKEAGKEDHFDELVNGVSEREGRKGEVWFNNCEPARWRSTSFSLQWSGGGISPSALSVRLIKEPLGTWQKLLVGCDGRIRRTPPFLHRLQSLHRVFLPNSHQQAPRTRAGKKSTSISDTTGLTHFNNILHLQWNCLPKKKCQRSTAASYMARSDWSQP